MKSLAIQCWLPALYTYFVASYVSLQKVVAANIKGYRLKLELTQEKLAMSAKLHPNHLARMERGEKGVAASLESIDKLAKALRIAPHLLLIPESYKRE